MILFNNFNILNIFYTFICLKELKTYITQFYHILNLVYFYIILCNLIIYLLNSPYQHLKVRNSILLLGWPPERIHLEKKD